MICMYLVAIYRRQTLQIVSWKVSSSVLDKYIKVNIWHLDFFYYSGTLWHSKLRGKKKSLSRTFHHGEINNQTWQKLLPVSKWPRKVGGMGSTTLMTWQQGLNVKLCKTLSIEVGSKIVNKTFTTQAISHTTPNYAVPMLISSTFRRIPTLLIDSKSGMSTHLMKPICAVGLVTLFRSMNGATGSPSAFSRSLCECTTM